MNRDGRAGAIGLIVGITVLLGCGVFLFSSSGVDDTFITYGVARNLATTGRILNWNGQAVEQSSSLFLVVWLAALFKCTHIELTTLGGLSSILFGCGALVLLGRFANRAAPQVGGWVVVLTATSFPFLLWCYSGMEQSAYVFLLAAFFTLFDELVRAPRSTKLWVGQGLVTAALVLVRPEAALLMVLVLVAVLSLRLVHRVDAPITTILGAIGCLAGCALVVAIYRQVTFGMPFPLPVLTKTGHLTRAKLLDGLHYLVWGLPSIVVIVMSALGVVLTIITVARRVNVALALSALFVAAQLSFVTLAGGDWMPGGRFLVPLAPFAFVACCAAMPSRRVWIGAAVVCALNVFVVNVSYRFVPGRAFWKGTSLPMELGASLPWFVRYNPVYTRDYLFTLRLRELVERMYVSTHRPVNLLTEHAGTTLYWLTEKDADKIRFVDRHGITTRDFTDCIVSKGLPRNTVGIDVTYEYIFDNQAALSERCAIPRADLIQDLEFERPPSKYWKRALESGYRLVAHQDPIDSTGFSESALVTEAAWPSVADLATPVP